MQIFNSRVDAFDAINAVGEFDKINTSDESEGNERGRESKQMNWEDHKPLIQVFDSDHINFYHVPMSLRDNPVELNKVIGWQ